MESKREWASRLVEGALAGAIASVAMTAFQTHSKRFFDRTFSKKRPISSLEDSTTVKIANMVHQVVTRNPLPEKYKPLAGQIVHYAFGTSLGAVFAILGQRKPRLQKGPAYGAAVWLLADEISLWLLGIAKSPRDYPLGTHVYGLASHLAYGTALGLTTQVEKRIEKKLSSNAA